MDEIEEIKKKQRWQLEYMDEMVKAGVSSQMAKDSFEAGRGDFDFDEDPRDTAREDLSYWGD